MHATDFDATNLLSGEKHSDYENPFDKAHFLKGKYQKIEKKQSELYGTEHERKHDKLRTPSEIGKQSESKNFKTSDKGGVDKANAVTAEWKTKISLKQGDNAKVTSTVNKNITQTPETLIENEHKGTVLMKLITRGTTATAKPETKSRFSHLGYESDDEDVKVDDTKINTNPGLSGDVTIVHEKIANKIMEPGYSHNVECRNILGGEGAPPYVTVLISSVCVLAGVLIILCAILFYKRRHRKKPVISDEMYNAYKLSKKMAERSPLPSPRGSEQGGCPEYDFITADSSSTHLTWETTTASQETGASVYLELDDDSRYDYATAPVTPD